MYEHLKVEKNVEIPEYRLVCRRSIAHRVESVEDQITDIIELDVSDNTMFFKKTIKVTFL